MINITGNVAVMVFVPVKRKVKFKVATRPRLCRYRIVSLALENVTDEPWDGNL